MKAALTRAVLPRGNDLVHQLQLERGCSCAWVASGGALLDFENLVISHRGLTTSMLSEPEHKQLKEIAHEPLLKLRKQSDAAVVGRGTAATDQELAEAFYQLLAGFTHLIATILDLDSQSLSPGMLEHVTPRLKAAMAFTELKEAMSIERAFVCGILSLPEPAVAHLPKRAFADFVLCLEKQRADKAAVRLAAPPHMLHILLAAFKLHPELEALQGLHAHSYARTHIAHTLRAHARIRSRACTFILLRQPARR